MFNLVWYILKCLIGKCDHNPARTLVLIYRAGMTTLTGDIMDITLHTGKREFFQLAGREADGDTAPFEGGALTEASSDPQIATVTANPDNASMIAIDGVAAGQTTISVFYTNDDGVVAQTLVLNVTVLHEDIVEIDASQIGVEVPAGSPFPTA